MECQLTTPKRRNAGIALAEMMIAMGIALLLVTTMTIVNIYYLKAFAGLENYMNLNNDSRYALDIMTRDIRQADFLVSKSATSLKLQLSTTNVSYTVAYEYDSVEKKLHRRVGDQDRKTLLTGCDYWRNDFYDRNQQTNNVTPANCKVIQVTWLCSREILKRKANTEDIQSARIVIRKQR